MTGHQSRRRVALILTLVSTTALMCAGGALAQEPVQLTFRQFDPPSDTQGLVKAVDAWNESHPDIQVKMETMGGSDTLAQLAREIPAGGGPDVQHLAFIWTRDLAKSGLLLPLDDLIAQDPPNVGIDDFLALDLAREGDKIYGVPWTADTFSMAYRPDLLEAAGIDSFPSTWDDLTAAAKTLTKGDQYGFCFPAGSSPDSAFWFLANYYLWSNGSTLVDQDSSGAWQIVATADDLAKDMAYFNGFFEDGSTSEDMITINSWTDPVIVGGLARGDCAITFFPPQTFRVTEEQSQEPLMTAEIPAGSKKRISHLGGRALGINPNSEHPKESWEFIKYLLSPETFESYKQYPAQKSILDAIDFPASEDGFVKMLPQAITFERYISSPIRVTSLQKVVNARFGAVFSGQSSPEEAAAALVSDLESLLERGSN
ncbi:ABC transporter substrate-binding protein [Consotaella aegiceratis]|uniref:ABC transporter substrate-binding protein n=1 Tax=Consotaella aegiceratis TaxID=3097961 RepID=UPI002F3E8A37